MEGIIIRNATIDDIERIADIKIEFGNKKYGLAIYEYDIANI